MAKFILKQKRLGKNAKQMTKHTPQHNLYFPFLATPITQVISLRYQAHQTATMVRSPFEPATMGGCQDTRQALPDPTVSRHLLSFPPQPPPVPSTPGTTGTPSPRKGSPRPPGPAGTAPPSRCISKAAPSCCICTGKHTSLGATFMILLQAGLAGLGADS